MPEHNGLHGKLMTVGEAVTRFVHDGDQVCVGGFTINRNPMAVTYEIARRRVTFEYILIDGVNDTPEHARRLLAISRSIPSKVNLILFNEYPGSPFRRSSDEAVETFQRILFDGNVTAFIRKSKGSDILAACGQLASAPRN